MQFSMEQKVLTIKDVGNVILKRSLQAKHINITIKPFQNVKVSVPRGISLKQAEKTVFKKLDWIKKHLPRIKKAEKKFTILDENSQFKTIEHVLQIKQQNRADIKVTVSKKIIKVLYPFSKNIHDNDIQLLIKKGIELAWRKEAKKYLPDKVKTLSKKFGFLYKNVVIKNAKTRWGSCSALTGNINLSLHVIRLPNPLIDYIILHELSHTIEKNHGKKFWALLNKITNGAAKKLDKELKNYHIQIY